MRINRYPNIDFVEWQDDILYYQECLTKQACKNDIDGAKERLASNKKMNVNFKGAEGWTALHYAVGHEHVEFVEFLIKQNANLNIACEYGYTPLKLAQGNYRHAINGTSTFKSSLEKLEKIIKLLTEAINKTLNK